MNIIFQINGGIGKCVAATAVCKAIKKKYPDANLIVISGYPDVFLNNPNVYRCYAFANMAYFYEQYVQNQEVLLFAHDPYMETSHIYQETHLIETWCNMFGIEYDNEMPEVFLTDRERNFYGNRFSSDKPIMVLQTNGGAEQNIKYSWARDIPAKVVAEVVAKYKAEYNIIHIKREDQVSFDGTVPFQDNFRAIAVLIEKSYKRLFMDSFCQHTAAALGKESVVLWIANKSQVFGYNVHKNMVCNEFTKKPELKASVYNKFNIVGDPLEFPFDTEHEMFDTEKIIKAIGD
jgi:ADP-heptose:LPS heptosyltransferase